MVRTLKDERHNQTLPVGRHNGYFRWYQILLLLLIGYMLCGCVSNIIAGADLIYDRHNVYKKLSDYQLATRVSYALYHDQEFKTQGCAIDIAVFNGDILLSGHVPSDDLRQKAYQRAAGIGGRRRIFNQLAVKAVPEDAVQDAWITTKIRSQIFAVSSINPSQFKVVTSDHIVYLMGDVIPGQADKVIRMARNTRGVRRVVTLLKYYHLSDKALEPPS